MVGLPIKVTHEKSQNGGYWVLKQEYKIPYEASVKQQLELWVAGKSTHNTFADECCPDFSCCEPDKQWPEDQRQLFMRASKEVRTQMLFGALGTLVAKAAPDKKVYIAGVDDPSSQVNPS